jgi:hypothetical protein
VRRHLHNKSNTQEVTLLNQVLRVVARSPPQKPDGAETPYPAAMCFWSGGRGSSCTSGQPGREVVDPDKAVLVDELEERDVVISQAKSLGMSV